MSLYQKRPDLTGGRCWSSIGTRTRRNVCSTVTRYARSSCPSSCALTSNWTAASIFTAPPQVRWPLVRACGPAYWKIGRLFFPAAAIQVIGIVADIGMAERRFFFHSAETGYTTPTLILATSGSYDAHIDDGLQLDLMRPRQGHGTQCCPDGNGPKKRIQGCKPPSLRLADLFAQAKLPVLRSRTVRNSTTCPIR